MLLLGAYDVHGSIKRKILNFLDGRANILSDIHASAVTTHERLLFGRAIGIEAEYLILPDDKVMIAASLVDLCEKRFRLVMTTGGTGLGPRDLTAEATAGIIEREIPGIMEAARSFGQRGVAGRRGNTLIVNLPGSSKGVEESLDAVFPAILHAFKMMRGAGHEISPVKNGNKP